jgi:hypothetical protein
MGKASPESNNRAEKLSEWPRPPRRYNIRIADDDCAYFEKLCQKLIAAGGACVVVRNDRG